MGKDKQGRRAEKEREWKKGKRKRYKQTDRQTDRRHLIELVFLNLSVFLLSELELLEIVSLCLL